MEVHYTWEIERFPTKTEIIQSPVFFGVLKGRLVHWSLLLLPNGEETPGFISVILTLETTDVNNLDVWCGFSCIDSSDIKSRLTESRKIARTFTQPDGKVFSLQKFVKRDIILNKANGLLIGGHILKIHCCIVENLESVNCVDLNSVALSDGNPMAGMWELYKQQKLVDVNITAGPKQFKAHKAILAARSDVFAAMFEHNLKEKATNTVVIEDIDPKVVEEMIRFIYLDVVDHLDELSLDLLSCSEKYQLKKMKNLCIQWLSRTLKTETAAKTLVAADLCQAPSLKARAMAHVTKNLKEVRKTAEWKEVLLYRDLTDELFEEVCEVWVK